MLKHYSFKQKAMMFINLAFYIIFLLMVIYGAFHTNGELLSILFVVVGIIALVFGVLSEYLKLRYNEALWYLNFKLDTAKAKEIYEDMLKKDLFGMYKNDRGLFDVMVAIEEKDGNKALKIIEENENKFNANVETLLIRLYYEMRACLLTGKDKKINEIYNDVKNIEAMKKRPKIFQYDELDGIYERARKNRSLAYEHFKKVNMANMNPKEMKFIFENLILTAPAEEKKQYQDGLDQLMKVVNESK